MSEGSRQSILYSNMLDINIKYQSSLNIKMELFFNWKILFVHDKLFFSQFLYVDWKWQ